jgi:hypothetical protein
MTEEILGNRTLIVATKTEIIVRSAHSELRSKPWAKQYSEAATAEV